MAKSKAVAQTPVTPTRRSKADLRASAARKRKNQNLMVAAAGVVVLLIVVAFIAMNMRGNQAVTGEESFASQGNLHIALGSTSPITYNSTPPTSGPHYENLASWGFQQQPVRYEHLIHNLEDGGVVIYYQCADGCPEIVAELESVLQPYFAAGRHVVLAPNDPNWTVSGSQPLHQDMGASIVLTAWQKRLALDAVDAEMIRTFVDRYEGIDHHRG